MPACWTDCPLQRRRISDPQAADLGIAALRRGDYGSANRRQAVPLSWPTRPIQHNDRSAPFAGRWSSWLVAQFAVGAQTLKAGAKSKWVAAYMALHVQTLHRADRRRPICRRGRSGRQGRLRHGRSDRPAERARAARPV